MHIVEMTVGPSSHPAFQEDMTLRFHKRANVFIGPNASGKTSLLRVLANVAFADDTATTPYQPVSIYVSDDWQRARNPNHIDGSIDWHEHILVDVPFSLIPAVRINLSALLDFQHRQLPFDKNNLISSLRTGPLDAETIHSAIEWQDNVQIFDGRWIANAIATIFDEYQRDFAGPFRSYPSVVRSACQCAEIIAGEVIVGGPSNYVTDDFATVVYAPDDIEPLALKPSFFPGMGVRVTTGQAKGSMQDYVGNLSAGTQNVYLWVLYLAFKMACFYEFKAGWNTKPAILLIDEIENHLHPTWQRRVIPALLDHFPGLQIFATTHSPFVVAGLKAGQVHLLNRDENGVVTASTNQQDIVGWTADEILRVYMGVGDPTDEQTARAGAELRRLRDMGPLADEREEAQRQTRIRELREIVNIAVLDGPRAAEDARFAATLEGILERYRQSKDLNQENGRDA